jgi:hypothetical protein
VALAVRDPGGQPMNNRSLEALRQHPDQVDKFERAYQANGLGRWYLHQWGVQ